jgi:hypothetical protein
MHLVSNFLKGYYDINNLTNKMNSFGLFKDIDNLIKNESSQLGKSEKNKLENQAYAICYGKSYRVFYFLRKQKFLRFLSLLFIIYFSTKFLGIYKGFFTSLLWVIVAYISTNYLITFIIFNKYKTSQ